MGDSKVGAPEEPEGHPAWIRLEDQIGFYDGRSVRNKKNYITIKIAQLIAAVAIPVLASNNWSFGVWIVGGLGAAVALLEGLQQLFQFSTLWIEYRSTAETLKHEKFLFLSGAGPYRDLTADESYKTLAERVEESVSTEHANWTTVVSRKRGEDEKK